MEFLWYCMELSVMTVIGGVLWSILGGFILILIGIIASLFIDNRE